MLKVDGGRRNDDSRAFSFASFPSRGAKGDGLDNARQQTGRCGAEGNGVKRRGRGVGAEGGG